MLASPTDAADLVELRGALDAAWAAQIQTWQDLGERTGRLAFLQLRSRRDLGALLFRALVREHGDRAGAECLRRLLAAERAGSAARALGLQPGTPAAVQATLAPAGGLLVAYLPAPLGSFAVVASAERIQAFELPSDLGLRPLATRLRQGLAADATAQQMRADALAAGTMLTTADMRAAWRQAKGIVFVGKDLLAGLPMECLAFDDGAEPPWLGLRTAVSCLPSMSLGLHLAAREKAVAAPQARALFATELAPADAARWGMQALDTSAQRQQATLAQVAAAQRRIVAPFSRADLRAEPAAAMALFAHGIYAADRESPNGFLAGPDGDRTGAVFAPDCGQLRFAPITALAVCGAARTALRRGDDGGGDLVDAVLQHGAEATLCSAIDLRVDDALDFVSEFFGALASGQDAAAAALSARRACARGATDRPSRWAGMSLHGLAGTTAPLRGADPADWRMRAALAAALIALLGLLARGYKKMKGNSGVTKRRLGGKSGGSV